MHIYDGTTSSNARDTFTVGNANFLRPGLPKAKGESHGLAKLTEDVVREIRRRYSKGGITQQELADEYGVGQGRVSAAIRRETWKHVE